MAKWESIAWSSLKYKGVSAERLADWFRALGAAQADVRGQARAALKERLCADASWSSASAPAVASLVDLAADPSTPDRGPALALAVDVMTVGHGWFLARGLDFRDPRVQSLFAEGTDARRALAAMEAEVPRLLALAADPDPAVRAAAAMALAFVASAASASRPELLRRLDEEPEALVRGSVAMALGMVGRYEPSPEIAPRLRALIASDAPETVRGVALAARLYVDFSPPSEQEIELANALLRAVQVDGTLLPWLDGRVDHLIARQLKEHAEGGALLAARLLVALVREAGPADALSKDRAWEALGALFDQEHGPYMPAELSDGQREVAGALTEIGVDVPFGLFNLPGDAGERRRFLGLEAPGPLDRTGVLDAPGVDRSWPLWTTIAFLREQDVDEDELAGRLRAALSPEDYLTVLAEWMLGAHGMPVMQNDLLRQAIEAAEPEVAERWARRLTQALLAEPARASATPAIRNYALLPLIRRLAAGEVLDERYDPLVTFLGPEALAREVLSGLPPERRERAVCREIEQRPDLAPRILLDRIAPLLDLAPTPRVIALITPALESLEKRAGSLDKRAAQRARQAITALGLDK